MLEAESRALLEPFLQHPKVLEMQQYIQHGDVTTYDHCLAVARNCELWNQRLHLHADLSVLLVGALLHDFYLYDWHEVGDGSHHLHGFRHASRAAKNAHHYFHISAQTAHVIACHMWPLNLTHLPHTREAWLVCLVDKLVSLRETLQSGAKVPAHGSAPHP